MYRSPTKNLDLNIYCIILDTTTEILTQILEGLYLMKSMSNSDKATQLTGLDVVSQEAARCCSSKLQEKSNIYSV